MQEFISGKLSFLVCAIFPLLVLGGLLMQRVVYKMRQTMDLAQYELERGPLEQAPPLPPPEEVVPGYTLMTFRNYEAISRELMQEWSAAQSIDNGACGAEQQTHQG